MKYNNPIKIRCREDTKPNPEVNTSKLQNDNGIIEIASFFRSLIPINSSDIPLYTQLLTPR
jgi:hypothetical protein